MSSPEAGAEIRTFFAPPARCLAASSRLVKKPVDSITTSAPRSPHGSAPGSRSARTLISSPSIAMPPSVTSTVPLYGPEHRVVLEEVGERLGIGQVVDGDPVDVGARRLRGADDVAADTAEAVDADAYGHGESVLPTGFRFSAAEAAVARREVKASERPSAGECTATTSRMLGRARVLPT